MFSSSTFNNSTTTTSPIFYVDNIVSYLIDDESTNYSTSYYHIPSPFIYNEIDNYGDFITNNHDELTLLQQSILATNNSNDNNNNNNNNNSSIDHTDDSSIFEVDNKVDCSHKGSGDHHEVEVNGIVDDNGEMNHHNISSTTTTTNTTNNSHHHGLIMKKKRRTSNKDRHSKIRTAHGLRDRRMRLSLQVARPFFKLQDLLGFDKASTTVEWLLMQSKPAIDELIQVKHGSSPSSGVTTTTNKCNTPISSNSDDYCDVESTTNEDREGDHNNNSMRKRVMKDEPKQKEMKRKRTTKEEKKVARERAKKRTLERMQTRGNNHPFTSLTNYQQQCFHDASYCQKNVPNYLISTQHNTMRGPQ